MFPSQPDPYPGGFWSDHQLDAAGFMFIGTPIVREPVFKFPKSEPVMFELNTPWTADNGRVLDKYGVRLGSFENHETAEAVVNLMNNVVPLLEGVQKLQEAAEPKPETETQEGFDKEQFRKTLLELAQQTFAARRAQSGLQGLTGVGMSGNWQIPQSAIDGATQLEP